MANTLLTPDVIARQALATLYENLVMVPLVHTDHSAEFSGPQKVGNTVTIRKPATFVANDFDRATGITIQDATETGTPISLDKIADVSFSVTSEDLRMEIQDFDTQLITPAVEALGQKVDRALIAALKAAVIQVAGGAAPVGFEWDKPEVLIEAGRQLDVAKIPTSLRHAVTGPTTRASWMNSDIIKHADKSGSTDALRAGSIGRNLFGFDAFMTQNIVQPDASPAPGAPTTEVGLAFHPRAISFVSAPMEVPPGSVGSVQSYNGVSIRMVQDYDIKYKKTVVSLDILYGTKVVDASAAVLLKGANAT